MPFEIDFGVQKTGKYHWGKETILLIQAVLKTKAEPSPHNLIYTWKTKSSKQKKSVTVSFSLATRYEWRCEYTTGRQKVFLFPSTINFSQKLNCRQMRMIKL